MVSTRLTQGVVEQCVAPGFGSPQWSDGWQLRSSRAFRAMAPATLFGAIGKRGSLARWWGRATITLELGERTLALGAAMPRTTYQIKGLQPATGKSWRRQHGDWQHGHLRLHMRADDLVRRCRRLRRVGHHFGAELRREGGDGGDQGEYY